MRGEAGAASANAALATALSVQLRLFAPFLPFVTEEVWSWWQEGSVHRAAWPTADELAAAAGGDPALLASVGLALSELRKAKSERKVSMRTELASAAVSGPGVAAAGAAVDDLRAAGRVLGALTLSDAAMLGAAVEVLGLGGRTGWRRDRGAERRAQALFSRRSRLGVSFSRGTRVGLTCSRTTSPVITTRATSWRLGTSYITGGGPPP